MQKESSRITTILCTLLYNLFIIYGLDCSILDIEFNRIEFCDTQYMFIINLSKQICLTVIIKICQSVFFRTASFKVNGS